MTQKSYHIDKNMDPFEADTFEVNDLQTDLELKVSSSKERYESFWTQQKLRQKYPIIWEEFRLLCIVFPSSYVVEKAFSLVINILSKIYNLDNCKGGDLRLYLTDLESDYKNLQAFMNLILRILLEFSSRNYFMKVFIYVIF